GEVATTENAPAGETDHATPQGYHSDFGRAAAEVAASQDSGAVDTIAELSQLDQRFRELSVEEKRIGEERRELTRLKQEVENLLVRQEAIADEKVLYMAKLLDGMKPDEMTGLVVELDNKMILRVLPKMKPQSASKLLAQLPPKRAAAITTALLDSESEE
ncbi:MAG TPA: hypothetical protein VM118_10900, partial [Acidobacteriota bacterium]|nr:hypothetical protein [Acidobacteriota bacterium]